MSKASEDSKSPALCMLIYKLNALEPICKLGCLRLERGFVDGTTMVVRYGPNYRYFANWPKLKDEQGLVVDSVEVGNNSLYSYYTFSSTINVLLRLVLWFPL